MNDLTKQDLEDLLFYMEHTDPFYFDESFFMLMARLESLIENYSDEPPTSFLAGKPRELKPKGCRCSHPFGCGGGCYE